MLDRFEAKGSQFDVNNVKAAAHPVVRVCHYLCQAIKDPVGEASQPVGLRMNSRGYMYWVDTDVELRPVIPPPRSHHPYRGFEYSGAFDPLTDAFKRPFAQSAEKYKLVNDPMPANPSPHGFSRDKRPEQTSEWSEWPGSEATRVARDACVSLPAGHSWIYAPDLCSDIAMRRTRIPNVPQQITPPTLIIILDQRALGVC